MKKQEELNEAWCNYMGKCSTEIMQALAFALRWADAHPDIDVRTMAAWQSGYKEAIEKACEWLDENMNDVGIRFMRGDEIKDIVDLFRKAMKGGERQ